MKCNACKREFDERLAVGVCPYCGSEYEQPVSGMNATDSVWIGESTAAGAQPFGRVRAEESSDTRDPKWLAPGTVLNGRYQILRVLGAGGFGITYLVRDLKTGAYKAVKEYFQQGVVNRLLGETNVFISAPKRREEFEYGRARFLEEARIVAKFQSPNIVKVDDFFAENNTTYMVMEYLDYPTLEDYIIRRRAPLDADEAVRIGVSLCEALEEIHRAGVIHRDIAPDNIFVTKDGVKIIDFGSARLSREDTEDLLIVTKPGYAPPEQYEQINLRRDRQKAWTDVYALGATLYMAVTGRVPVESTNRVADSDRNEDSLREPIEINANISEQLNNTIMTAMAINIHERFQNVTELKEALLEQRRVRPLEVVRKGKRRRRTAGITAGFLAAAMLFGVAGAKRLHEKKEIELPPASISVWYATSEDELFSQQETDAMDHILSELRSGAAFPKVEIELRAIPESEYAAALEQAAQEGALPTLFETPAEDSGVMAQTEPLDGVSKEITRGSCLFLDQYDRYFETGDRFPIGFHVPVIYINKTLVPDYTEDTKIGSMADFMQLCSGEMNRMSIGLNPADAGLYAEMMPDFQEHADAFQNGSAESFCEGRTVAYFSDSSDYYRIRSSLSGYFAMAVVDTNHLVCRFTDFWSIRACEDEAEAMAAEAFLVFLTSNTAQDYLFLHTNLPGLPLEKGVLQQYEDVVPTMYWNILSDYESFAALAP